MTDASIPETVRVRLFAAARDRAGSDTIEVAAAAVQTIGDLRQAIAEQFPELAPLLPYATMAVDEQYVSDAAPVDRRGEIAVIPPVSGG